MYYLPSNLINSNYLYNVNNNYIIVRTNHNCYQNYNTTYCDCYNVYPELDYMVTTSYSCNYTQSNANIPYSNFTSDTWYRIDAYKSLIMFLIVFIFTIYLGYKIISRLFGRWLKI